MGFLSFFNKIYLFESIIFCIFVFEKRIYMSNKKVKKKVKHPIWKKKPDEHDYPAAFDYLELLFSEKKSNKIVSKLRSAEMTKKKAKDILRASRLPLLERENLHVDLNIAKHLRGEALSPVLLVRSKSNLIIADGYHRVCAIYYISEDLNIPCKLV